MLFIVLLGIIASVNAEVLNQTTTITIHVGDDNHGHGHYTDDDYLFGEAIAVLFFIVILIACVGGFWTMEDNRRVPLAIPVP